MKKVSLHKFTHIPLLKNDVQLKQKKVTRNQKEKKKEMTQIILKNKNHVQEKKSCLVKKNKNKTKHHATAPGNYTPKKKKKDIHPVKQNAIKEATM